MTGGGWYNIISLLAGLVALVLPMAALARMHYIAGRGSPLIPALSMACCSLCFSLQILNHGLLVAANDWESISQSAPTVAGLCLLLLAMSMGLNMVLMFVQRRRSPGRVK